MEFQCACEVRTLFITHKEIQCMLLQLTIITLNTAWVIRRNASSFSLPPTLTYHFLSMCLVGVLFHVIAVFAAVIYIFKLNRSHQEVLLEAFALFIVERHCLEKSNC